jgi:chromosome segregation ATPase
MNQPLITIFSALGAAVIAWVLSRKKSQAEVRKITAEAVQIEIGNARAVINFWKETAESLTLKLDNLSRKCDELIIELELVRTENEQLKKKLDQVQSKM